MSASHDQRNPPDWRFDSEFKGADLGCGVLLLDLQFHFRKLERGATVRVLTHDAGAPHELPAWCRLTGNAFVQSAHPYYLLRKGSPTGEA